MDSSEHHPCAEFLDERGLVDSDFGMVVEQETIPMVKPVRWRPLVETLESRTVLTTPPSATSGLIAVLVPVQTAPNATTLYLVEGNTSKQDVSVAVGPSVSDFWVTQGSVEVWRMSKEGLTPDFATRLVPLAPGQAQIYSANWDGHDNEAGPPNPAGPFVFHGSANGLTAETTLPAPPVPQPTPLAAVLSVSISTVRTSYRPFQPVKFTVTETNTGNAPAHVGVAGPDWLTVTRNGKPVWQFVHRGPSPQVVVSLLPGQSRQYTVTWPGSFSMNRSSPHLGVFAAQVLLDGQIGVGSFRVARA